ncbi:MAG TPA: hypothetical protein VER36_03075 [Flavisolibacter sp.]|nr:hypothetical protein [Flavisolibacter sp.]
MIEKVVFLPAASQDGRKIHEWYEKQEPGVGEMFTAEVFQQVEELQKNIVVHRIFFNNIRYVPLRKFPSLSFIALMKNRNNCLSLPFWGTNKTN